MNHAPSHAPLLQSETFMGQMVNGTLVVGALQMVASAATSLLVSSTSRVDRRGGRTAPLASLTARKERSDRRPMQASRPAVQTGM